MRPQDATPRPEGGYVERLWPAWWVWGVGLLAGTSIGIVWLRVGDGTQAVIAALLGIGAVLLALIWTTPTIRVDGDTVRAGRATAPRWALGEARALDAEQWRHAMGRGSDARAFCCQRGWIPAGVRVQVTDPDDPTPHWLLSSRRPDALAAALQGRQRQTAAPTPTS